MTLEERATRRVRLAVHRAAAGGDAGAVGELEDSANELNSDTFGGDGPVGRDFDFSAQGQGAAPAPKQTPAWNLDDDFLLGPRSNVPRPPPANQPPAPRMRTLEEIEAELLAANRSPPPFAPLPPPSAPQQQASRPRTLEEIEAEMFKAAGPSPPASLPPMQQQQGPPAISMQNLPAVFQNRPMPPIPQQFQAMPFNKMAAANRPEQFPPLGANGPVVPPPRPQADQHSLGQLHGARIAILHRFPNGQIPPDQIAILQQLDAAIQEAERRELLLRKKAHKLVELSSHNGLMSNSEKDFITRIQLSQLFNSLGPNGAHDPLKDDFYFTVFTAIRGARLQAQQGGKRRNQMTKMATQVQRIVDDARKKPRSAQCGLVAI
jgi:DNA topoisomerase 2-associated protein PAT1